MDHCLVKFPFKRVDWVGCYFAFLISVGVLFLSGQIPDFGRWYSSQFVQRQQTEALMHGRFALSYSPGDLEHDECWSGGGVQQVWGLGVSVWRLPFELLARACGRDAFPDRITLGIGIFLVAFLVFRTFARLDLSNKDVKRITLVGLLSCFLIVLFPPFVGLFFSRMAVYEEVAVYAYLYGIILLLFLVRFCRQPNLKLWILLCFLSGIGPFLRPTLTFYGVATVFIAWLFLYQRGATVSPVKNGLLPDYRWWLGPCIFALGGLLLFFTNQQRFGDGLEFGHRLNLQTGESLFGSMYATRFDHPYEQEPIVPASKELFGALFLEKNFNFYDWYQDDIFPGQSKTVRWREFYLCTYDLSYFALITLGGIVGLISLRKFVCKKITQKPEIGYLGLWSLASTFFLVVFYLHTPAIASRYMLDFAPAFVASILVVLLQISSLKTERFPRLGRNFIIIWLGVEFAMTIFVNTVRGNPSPWITDYNGIANILHDSQVEGEGINQFETHGWDTTNGNVRVCVTVFVHDPKFLELNVSPSDHSQLQPEIIRAKIQTEFLKRESIEKTDQGWKIRFHGPERTDYQKGVQTAFFAFTTKENLDATNAPFRLTSVRWGDGPTDLRKVGLSLQDRGETKQRR